MIINMTTFASDMLLNTLASLVDGGSIEILTIDQQPLAVLKLSDPAAMAAFGGKLEFNKIFEENAALAQGVAERAIIKAADGTHIAFCDVGDINSEAVIKLNTTKIFRGSPVRLTSFQMAF